MKRSLHPVLQQDLIHKMVQQSQFRRRWASMLVTPTLAAVALSTAACSGGVEENSWGTDLGQMPGTPNSPNTPANPNDPNTPPGVNPPGTPGIPGQNPPPVDSNGNPVPPGVTPGVTPNPPSVPPIPPPGTPLSECTTPGPRQIRRLSPTQYARTVQAIFNDPNVPHEDVLSLPSVLGFHIDADAAVIRDLDGELLMNYAESVAEWAVTNGKVNQFTSCTQQQTHCQTEFINKI